MARGKQAGSRVFVGRREPSRRERQTGTRFALGSTTGSKTPKKKR